MSNSVARLSSIVFPKSPVPASLYGRPLTHPTPLHDIAAEETLVVKVNSRLISPRPCSQSRTGSIDQEHSFDIPAVFSFQVALGTIAATFNSNEVPIGPIRGATWLTRCPMGTIGEIDALTALPAEFNPCASVRSAASILVLRHSTNHV